YGIENLAYCPKRVQVQLTCVPRPCTTGVYPFAGDRLSSIPALSGIASALFLALIERHCHENSSRNETGSLGCCRRGRRIGNRRIHMGRMGTGRQGWGGGDA